MQVAGSTPAFSSTNEVIFIFTTKDKGDITELTCILGLKRLGIHVSIPYGENVPYDIVADINGVLYRIQCKSSVYEAGSISFSCRTIHYNTKTRKSESYIGKIDFYMTCIGSKCYMIPIEDCKNSSSKRLRVQNPRNNQKKNVSYAEDYELQRVVSTMLV